MIKHPAGLHSYQHLKFPSLWSWELCLFRTWNIEYDVHLQLKYPNSMHLHLQECIPQLSVVTEHMFTLNFYSGGRSGKSYWKGHEQKSSRKIFFFLLYQVLRLLDHLDFLVSISKCTVQLKYVQNHHRNTSIIIYHRRKIIPLSD